MNGYPLAAVAGWGVVCCAAGFATAWCSKPERPTRIETRTEETQSEHHRGRENP